MSLGIDWEQTSNYYKNRAAAVNKGTYSTNAAADSSLITANTNNYGGNTCTDGKDDGKIGLGSVLLNIGEGAIKGVFNGIKGMFTNGEGKFSLGKTLLTLGMGAVCCAFPALGFAACCVGGAVGGYKLVTGVGKALSADTDAEAKAAWEQVGDGGLTVATSVIGAKATLGAVKSTSTAGIKGLDQMDDVAKAAAISEAKASGTNSALSQLDDSASITQKIGALFKDMGSSTKNNFLNIKAFCQGTLEKHKQYKQGLSDKESKLQAAKEALEKAKKTKKPNKIKSAEDLVKQYENEIKAYKEEGNVFKNLAKKIIPDKETGSEIKNAKKSVRQENKNLRKLKFGKDTTQEQLNAANDALKAAKTTLNNARAKTPFGQLTNKLTETNTQQAIKNLKNCDEGKLTSIWQGLSNDGRAILSALQNNESNVAQLTSKYGYENVLQVLEMLIGLEKTSDSV